MNIKARDESLSKTQRELEAINLAEAAERFWKRIAGELDDTEREAGIESRRKQNISTSAPGARFIREKVEGIAKRIETEYENIQAGRGGKGNSNIISFLYAHSLEAIAYLALKEIVDRGCRNIKTRCSALFRYDLIINAIGRNVTLELEASKQKSGTGSLPAVAKLDEAIKNGKNTEEKKRLKRRKRNLINRLAKVDFTDELSKARIGHVLYKALLDEKLLVESNYDGYKKTVQLANDVLQLLESNLNDFANQKPLWGPLVVPPRQWSNNGDGGYHYDLKSKHTLLKTAGKDFCAANVPAVFSAVNTLQSTAFRINKTILDTAIRIFSTDRTGETFDELFGISQTLPIEIRRWLVVSVKRIFADANRMKEHSKIYFTCFLDFRGRYYCKTTHLNPQGTDLCRGLIEFADAKPINDEKSVRWLINHGAACYGNDLDRGAFSDREKWIRDEENSERIRALVHDPTSAENRDFLKSADKPWEFLAWCHDWTGFCDAGYGYESRLPVAVDGSCNGIQHFAALTRSRELAEQVNLAKSERPSDIYKTVAEKTEKRLRQRCEAMTWYSSLTMNDFVKKYDSYSRQLYQLKNNENFKFDEKNTQTETSIFEEDNEELAERLAENYFDEIEADVKNTDHDREGSGELKNMESVRNGRWDRLSTNKKMECLQECKRQLAECMLMSAVSDPEVKPISFTRKLIKSIVMTFPYSATHNGNVNGMVEQLRSNIYLPYWNYLRENASSFYQPEHAFAHAIVRNTRAVIRDVLLIYKIIEFSSKNKCFKAPLSWVSPTGLSVHQYYAKPDVSNRITLEYSGMKIYLQKLCRGKTALLHKHKQGISPNFVHSCDAAHMMKTVNAAKTAGIDSFLMIHDSYATHAADVEKLSRILREEFVKMYAKDNPEHPLEKLRQAFSSADESKRGKRSKKKQTLTMGDFDINEVLQSDYFFS